MKRAVLYARYSSDRQTEQSIEGQIRVCNEFAKNNGYTIIHHYIDRAMTGTNDNREAFQQMIADSYNKNFEYVLVYKLDRFSRNRYDSVINKAKLKKNGVKLISATEPITEQPEGIILESLLEGMAEYYSAELAQKVKRGMRESRLKGFFTGGKPLFGYEVIDRKLYVKQSDALIVKEIYKEFLHGYSMTEIAEMLNKKGCRIEGREFKKGFISRILHCEKYTGRYIVDGEEYPDIFPSIIDEDTFNEAQLLASERKGKGARYEAKTEPFLLTGKIMCCECGGHYVGASGTSRSGRVYLYYKCYERCKRINDCKSQTINKREMEDFVLRETLKMLNKPEIIDEMVKKSVEAYNNDIKENADLISVKKRLLEVNKQIDNFMIAIGKGLLGDNIVSALNDLNNRKRELEDEKLMIETLMEHPISEDFVRNFIQDFLYKDYDSFINKKRFFDLFIKKIFLNKNGTITIICNTFKADYKQKEHLNNKVFELVSYGGGSGIRTLARLSPTVGFQDRSLQPLG